MAVGVLQKTRILKNVKYFQTPVLSVISKRNSTIPDTVILERNINEEIIISIPKTISFVADIIGPPHPVSNLRPIVWYRSPAETILQKKLRDLQEATQNWNQRFWTKHNTKFINERKLFIEKNLLGDVEKQTLTADEMSGFYREFLDKNWSNHVSYNFQWYKRNFTILLLSIIVNIERLFHR